MTDIFTNTTAFGLLDAETQRALRDWPHGWEIYTSWGSWQALTESAWALNSIYRARPAPVTKPSIDWSHVAEGWNWLAVDEDGQGWLYRIKPRISYQAWDCSVHACVACAFPSYRPGTCDWRESLICRPGFEVTA